MNQTNRKQNITPQEISPKQMSLLLQMQRNILYDVAVPLDDGKTLNSLCRAAERLPPDSVASIMLFNDDHTSLDVRCAPSIPKAAIEALNGLQPGPEAGSCDNAVFREEPVYVCNTLTDERWEFVMDLPNDKDSLTLAKMIIALGHSFGLTVVAEGVETLDQHEFLVNEGRDIFQGYLFSKPISATEFEALLQSCSD